MSEPRDPVREALERIDREESIAYGRISTLLSSDQHVLVMQALDSLSEAINDALQLDFAAATTRPEAGLDVERLRSEIEAELELVPRRKRPQFDAGAAAAYSFVLSLLPPPLALLPFAAPADGEETE